MAHHKRSLFQYGHEFHECQKVAKGVIEGLIVIIFKFRTKKQFKNW